MKVAVVSYSFTGNNTRFAEHLARASSARQITVGTQKPVTYGTITLDMILHRKPEIDLDPFALRGYDLILIVGPVWLGKVAFPLRRCLDMLKRSRQPYAFLSVSGGADGDNPHLAEELKQRIGSKPVFVLDQHIRELLPGEPKPTRDDTSNYRLSDADCALFAGRAMEAVRQYFPNVI
jgi:hypothetical protein